MAGRRSLSRTAVTIAAVGLLHCGDIVLRTSAEYLPFRPGNWWRLVENGIYDPRVILAEVEDPDTLAGIECLPVDYSGQVEYVYRTAEALRRYAEIVYSLSGTEHTIAAGFLTRIPLPLLDGCRFTDSLVDSSNIAGVWIRGTYRIDGLVVAEPEDPHYAGVYRVITTTTRILALPDTTIEQRARREEFFAPDIGLVRLILDDVEYSLTDYLVR